MATKTKRFERIKRRHQTRATTATLDYRAFKVRAKSADDTKRTIDASITTETPVYEWDWQRGEMVPRVLLTEGAQIPKSRQVPLLDTHSRYSIDSQLGSIRGLAKEQNGVRGTLEFSSAASDSWTKVREGHVTDVSAGFEVLNETYLAPGESRTWYGKEFTGPMNVATKWRLREGSVVPIGADEAAKMRGYRVAGGKLVREADPKHQPAPSGGNPKETVKVNPELKARCVAAGMDATLNDEQAMTWLNANLERVAKPAPTPTPAQGEDIKRLAEEIKALREETLRAQQQREQREAFERDVDSTLGLVFGEQVPADIRRDALNCKNIEEARGKIAEGKKKIQDEQPLGGGFRMEFTAASRDKHREVMQTALLVRGYDLQGYGNADKKLPEAQRAKGWEQFRNAPLLEIARECLIADGYSYRDLMGLSRQSLAIAAMGWPHKAGLRSFDAGAYHMTGSLAYITLDAINKNLTAGYTEAPSTWRGPMRQAASVPDFKNKHIIKMGAVGNLPIWQDNKAPHESAISNEKETYCVEARAETISFSWQLLVNDDMDALSRGPALLGAAAARTVNAVAWAQVTGNPTLSDAQALFLENATGNRKRSNLTTGSATPSNTTLNTMTSKMMQMRGLNTPEGNESADILNIMPVYLIGPSALRDTILKQTMSAADPALTGSSAVFNSAKGLIPIIEPLLDASSTTAWYLFASPSQVDTIEVSFLQGQETPVVNDYVEEATLARNVTVIQSFAAKAADHRGVQKHAGA